MSVAGHSITHGSFSGIPLTFNGMTAIAFTKEARIGVDITYTSFRLFFCENPEIRTFLWEKILRNKEYITEISFAIYMLVSIIIVFIVGTIIEWIRQYIEKILVFY